MLKVIIGIELSFSCSRQLPGASRSLSLSCSRQLPGSFRELPGASHKLPGRAGMVKVIIGIELSLLPAASGSFQEPITFVLPAASRELPGASRSFSGASRKSRNAKSDNWNRIMTFVLPAASRELPGRAGMLKVIIGIELSFSCSSGRFRDSRSLSLSCSRQLPGSFRELPGASRELPGRAGMVKVIIRIELSLLPAASGSFQELITFVLPAASGSFQELPGSFQEEPEC